MLFKRNVVLLVIGLGTLFNCAGSSPSPPGAYQPVKQEDSGETNGNVENSHSHENNLETEPVSTMAPLDALLKAFNEGSKHQWIRKEMVKSIFGEMLEENTPYNEILTHHPINSELTISSEQQICDKLNRHVKHHLQNEHGNQLKLTLETLVDLKPFADLIEKSWEKLQSDFPHQLGSLPLDLFCVDHRYDFVKALKKCHSCVDKRDEIAFNHLGVVKSYELVIHCLPEHPFYEEKKDQFKLVRKGIAFLESVIYNYSWTWSDTEHAKASMLEHPICAIWKSVAQVYEIPIPIEQPFHSYEPPPYGMPPPPPGMPPFHGMPPPPPGMPYHHGMPPPPPGMPPYGMPPPGGPSMHPHQCNVM